jgi:hypothetical protein
MPSGTKTILAFDDARRGSLLDLESGRYGYAVLTPTGQPMLDALRGLPVGPSTGSAQ